MNNRENCYFCKKKLKDNERFCTKCGQDQKQSFNYLLLLGCVIAFWIIVFFILNPFGLSMPKFPRLTSNSTRIMGDSNNELQSYLTNLGLSKKDSEKLLKQLPKGLSQKESAELLKKLYNQDLSSLQDLGSFNGTISDEMLEDSLKLSENLLNSFFGEVTENTTQKTFSDPETIMAALMSISSKETAKQQISLINGIAKDIEADPKDLDFLLKATAGEIIFELYNTQEFTPEQEIYLKDLFSSKLELSKKDGYKVFDFFSGKQSSDVKKAEKEWNEVIKILTPVYLKYPPE